MMTSNPSRIAPRSTVSPRAALTQQVILREITVPTNHSVQMAPDLGPSAMIGTFMLQSVTLNTFRCWLTLVNVTDPSTFFPPAIEIPVGAAPVFQIVAQPDQASTVVWDLSQYWLIGDNQHPGQQAAIMLAAYPLAL